MFSVDNEIQVNVIKSYFLISADNLISVKMSPNYMENSKSEKQHYNGQS